MEEIKVAIPLENRVRTRTELYPKKEYFYCRNTLRKSGENEFTSSVEHAKELAEEFVAIPLENRVRTSP